MERRRSWLKQLTLPGIVENFAMTVRRGEIMCIAGQVGSGAAEIVSALAGSGA